MSRRVCEQANAECPYYEREPMPELKGKAEHGCYSDLDHLTSQRLAYDALSNYFIRRPENKQQLCRAEHDEKNYREQVTGVDDFPLPSEQYLRQVALNDIEAGREVPRSVRKKLRKDREQIAQRRAEVLSSFWQNVEERRA